MRYVQALMWLAIFVPINLFADVNIADWVGRYAMNHDGHVGTLNIEDMGKKCYPPQWCNLRLSYTDNNGTVLGARILLMDQAWQHMAFVVSFPNNPQRFDVYLFAQDTTKMAGTTVWQGQTFGIFATKQGAAATGLKVAPFAHRAAVTGLSQQVSEGATGQCKPSGKPTIVMQSSGRFELHYPDGSVRLQAGCGFDTICPDGRRIPASCMMVQAQPPTPPPMPDDDTTKKWLEFHNNALMDILVGLLGNDRNSIQNYKSSHEGQLVSLYQQMAERTKVISALAVLPQ